MEYTPIVYTPIVYTSIVYTPIVLCINIYRNHVLGFQSSMINDFKWPTLYMHAFPFPLVPLSDIYTVYHI